MTAMTAATLDSLSGGRFRLGLGVSGPQVSEGWYGVRFDKPLARTREYVDIVRLAHVPRAARRTTASTGRCRCPTAPASRCKLTVHPVARAHPDLPRRDRPEEPGADRRDRRRLAAGLLRAPSTLEETAIAHIARRPGEGRARRWTASTSSRPCRWRSATTWRRCADLVRPYAALYVGGMGSRKQNFYNQLATADGLRATPPRGPGPVPAAKSTGTPRPRVPLEFIDRTSLLGSVERIAERMRAYAEAGVTTLAGAVRRRRRGRRARAAADQRGVREVRAGGVGGCTSGRRSCSASSKA